jgi:hypothetical protein
MRPYRCPLRRQSRGCSLAAYCRPGNPCCQQHGIASPKSRGFFRSPNCWAISPGSGSTWCWQSLHQTMNRSWAAAAPPSVMGGPGSDFTRVLYLYVKKCYVIRRIRHDIQS